MKIHVLSGDSLVVPFKNTGIEGEVVVCRECLVDGDRNAGDLREFWNVREKYLSQAYPEAGLNYRDSVVGEFERLLDLADGNEIYLWFEYELFCQVNLWFTIWLLRKIDNALLNVVYPKLKDADDIWKGFGWSSNKELNESYEAALRLERADNLLASDLWESFQSGDLERLRSLSDTETRTFPTLKQLGVAACEIDTRPQNSISRIMNAGMTEFGEVFREFSKGEAIYGFGDLHVKRIYNTTKEAFRHDSTI